MLPQLWSSHYLELAVLQIAQVPPHELQSHPAMSTQLLPQSILEQAPSLSALTPGSP